MNTVPAGTSSSQLLFSIRAAIRNIVGDDADGAQAIVLEGMSECEVTREENQSPTTSPLQPPLSVEVDGGLQESTSSLSMQQSELPLGLKLQRDLNRGRELFVGTAIDFAARQRRIEGIVRQFTNHATSVVENSFALMLRTRWLECPSRCGLLRWMGMQKEVSSRSENDGGNATDIVESWLPSTGDSFVLDGIEYTLLHTEATVAGHADQLQRELLDDLNRRAQTLGPDAVKLTTLPEHLLARSTTLAFERVRKAAHREVKARRQIIELHHMESYCQTPLCAAVDYMGLTFFAEAACGFTKKTCHGGLFLTTQEQYMRVFSNNDAVPHTHLTAHLHRALSVAFCLKTHPKCGVSSYGPVDLQTHVPPDGTVYVRCCRRVLPPIVSLLGGFRPPSTLGPTQPTSQVAGCRMLPEFLEAVPECGGASFASQGLALSPDCWLDEPARTIDNADVECLSVNQLLHDKAIPLVSEIIGRVDEALRISRPSQQRIGRHLPTRIMDARLAASLWTPHFQTTDAPGRTLKALLHTYGVNLCFMGRILEWVVSALDAFPSMDAARTEALKAPGSLLEELTTPFVDAHPMVAVLRVEICSRALRAVVQAEQRRTVAQWISACSVRDGRRMDPTSLQRVVGESTCEVLCRCSGELMSSQSGDDESFWNVELIPMIQVMFGCHIPFMRASSSTSTAPGDRRVLGLSTAARIRTRALRQDEGGEPELQSRAMTLAAVDVAPWGHVTDARYGYTVPSEAYVTASSHNLQSSVQTSLVRHDDSEVDHRCATSSGPEKPRFPAARDGIRLGACQDFRVGLRTCEMLSTVVERRPDSMLGFACRCTPHVITMEGASHPIDAVSLTKIVLGDGRAVESALMDDMKERKLRSTSGLSADIALLRSYHSLALVSVFRGALQASVEWATKMREAFARDLANNDLGQGMMLAFGSRLELLRRRPQDATDLANHALTTISDVARGTQLVPMCMSILLDSLDAGGSPGLKGRKSELARQLVPLCLRFGLPVGRVAAREAMHRIQLALLPPKPTPAASLIEDNHSKGVASPKRTRTSPQKMRRANSIGASMDVESESNVQPQGPPKYVKKQRPSLDRKLLRFLAACCELMIQEQGRLDPEVSSAAVHLFLWTGDIQFLPLATAVLSHAISLTDQLYQPCCEILAEYLHEYMGRATSDGSNVTFRQLLHMLTTPHSTIREPCMLMAYFRQQLATRRLQEAHRSAKSDLASKASQDKVLVRGVSSILATTKKAQSFQRAIHAMSHVTDTGGGHPHDGDAVDEDRVELQGYYYLRKDADLAITGGDADSLVVHCALYLAKQFLINILDGVGPAARQDPQRWDSVSAALFGDLLNLTKFFSDARLDVAVLINRMLSSILDEQTLPNGIASRSASKCLELFSRDQGNAVTPVIQSICDDDGFRLMSSVAPVSLLATPFVWFLHDATYLIIGKQMELMGLLEHRVRSELVAEEEPKRGPQLEWVKELFFSCECGIELIAALRQVHRHGSVRDPERMLSNGCTSSSSPPRVVSPGRAPHHSVSTIFQFAAVQPVAQPQLPDDSIAGAPHTHVPPGMLSCTALDRSHMDLVVGIFNPALLTQEAINVPMRRLLETYLLHPTTFHQRIATVADRFPMQRHSLWHCYFRFCEASYEAHLDLSAPIENPLSGGRSEAQLKEMRSVLSAILTISAEHLGSFPNRHLLVEALRLCADRTGVDCKRIVSDQPLAIGRGALAVSSTTTQLAGDASLLKSGSFHLSKRSHAHTDISPARAQDASNVGNSFESTKSAGSFSILPRPMLAMDEPPIASLRVTTTNLHHGDPVRVEWTLPTRVPPKFAAVGLFNAPSSIPLVAANAVEMHKGLRFRQWRGHEEFRAPMKTGKFIVVFFITAHSHGLPVEGMMDTIQVEPQLEPSGPPPKLRHEVQRELEASPMVSVVHLASSSANCFIPCDSATSERARHEAMLRRAIRQDVGLSHKRTSSLPQSQTRSTSSMSMQAVSEHLTDASTLCCIKSRTPEPSTNMTIFKRDQDAAEAAKKRGEDRYRKSIRSMKTKLEMQGALVVLVGGTK